MTDEEIMVNFLKTIPVYQAPFLTMPFTLENSETSSDHTRQGFLQLHA